MIKVGTFEFARDPVVPFNVSDIGDVQNRVIAFAEGRELRHYSYKNVIYNCIINKGGMQA